MEQWYLSIWWLLANGVTEYLSFDFFLACTRARKRPWQILAWLVVSGLWVLLTIRFHFWGIYLLNSFCLILFARICLHLKWADLAAPAGILLALNTFAEGFSAVVMSWFSKNVQLASGGELIQIPVSVMLDLLFFLSLWFMKKRYVLFLQQPASSYLYILLLPCMLIVWAVRYGLQLDHGSFEEYLSSFGTSGSFRILWIMAAAVVIFFLILEVFCKLLSMADHEKTAALLKSQLDGQRIYMEEARRRNEQYASFQHDIDNHLLVLAGLLRDKQYEEAESYGKRLQVRCEELFVSVSTGNLILDLLLKEKISYGRGSGVHVDCNVQIPSGFLADDLDLCMIFANLMDNGICACQKERPENRSLSVSTYSRYGFLVIEAVNPYTSGQPVRMGTGLKNIGKMAERYQGTMEIQTDRNQFLIRVLLCSKAEE